MAARPAPATIAAEAIQEVLLITHQTAPGKLNEPASSVATPAGKYGPLHPILFERNESFTLAQFSAKVNAVVSGTAPANIGLIFVEANLGNSSGTITITREIAKYLLDTFEAAHVRLFSPGTGGIDFSSLTELASLYMRAETKKVKEDGGVAEHIELVSRLSMNSGELLITNLNAHSPEAARMRSRHESQSPVKRGGSKVPKNSGSGSSAAGGAGAESGMRDDFTATTIAPTLASSPKSRGRDEGEHPFAFPDPRSASEVPRVLGRTAISRSRSVADVTAGGNTGAATAEAAALAIHDTAGAGTTEQKRQNNAELAIAVVVERGAEVRLAPMQEVSRSTEEAVTQQAAAGSAVAALTATPARLPLEVLGAAVRRGDAPVADPARAGYCLPFREMMADWGAQMAARLGFGPRT